MKDIKSYVIGFLTCACLFLIMGQTLSLDDYKKIQAEETKKTQETIGRFQVVSHKTYLWMIDTRTAETFILSGFHKDGVDHLGKNVWKIKTDEQIWH